MAKPNPDSSRVQAAPIPANNQLPDSNMYCRLPPGTVNDSKAVRQLPDSLIIESNYRLWGATVRNEFHPRIIQSAFEHGQHSGQIGAGVCPYWGAQAVAWIRGYYYASRQDGSATHIHPSPCLPTCEWKRLREPVRLNTSPKTVPQVISFIDNLSSDIDYLGSEWGRRMRSEPNPWYRENHINRLYKESGNDYKVPAVTSDNLDWGTQTRALGSNPESGSKKNFKVYGPKILAGFMSENQLRFHRGYRELEDIRQKEILWVCFVPEVTQERKLNLLKITQAEYDRLLDPSLTAVAREIGLIDAEALSKDAEALIKREAASNQTSQDVVGPLWPCRIFSYVHKAAINDSRRNPFPICLSLNGHYNPQSPFVEGSIDSNMYYKHPSGELLTVIPPWKWMQLRHQKRLDNHLAEIRISQGQLAQITQESKPIRILRQRRKEQWLAGKEDDLKQIGKLKGLNNISIAGRNSGEDVLRAIEGLNNNALLPAYGSDDTFDQKAMRGYQSPEKVKIFGIQNPEVQLEIRQKLAEFEEKISEAEEQGLTDLCEQHKKDMADFKRLTKGSCITKTRSRPADEGDIFRPMLDKFSKRKGRALGRLRKEGLHDEADDLNECYKIENRSVIFFSSRSRFTWVFDKD